MAQNDSTMHYAVDLNGEWDENTGRSLPVQFTGELTIPANMTLECHSGGGMEVLGTMCVYGEMVCNADIQVSGGLVMCLGSTAELQGDATDRSIAAARTSAVRKRCWRCWRSWMPPAMRIRSGWCAKMTAATRCLPSAAT